MKKKKIIMLFLFAGCIWMGGCKDGKNPLDSTNIESGDDKNPFNPPIFEIEDTTFIEIEDSTFIEIEDSTIIAFKDLKVEDAQRLVQGKWRVFMRCGGIVGKCYDLTDVYSEYIGITNYRTINAESTSDYSISKWKKTKTGYNVYLSPSVDVRVPSFELAYLFNIDTLYYRQVEITDGFDWMAVRVK
jgi:hypothetical protein